MEMMNKPQEAIMLAQGMTKSFADLLVSQKKSKNYWSECHSVQKKIPSSNMDKLKKMCNGEE